MKPEQSYLAIIENNSDRTAYNCGIGLNWHEDYGYNYLDTVCEDIYNNKTPSRMAWVGSLAYQLDPEVIDESTGEILYESFISTLHYDCWRRHYGFKETKRTDFTLDNKYIINHSKRIFIDFNHYYSQNNIHGHLADYGDFDHCIHPLPILTNIGFGLGEHETCTDKNYIDAMGSWAWDEISIENNVPNGYTEITYLFKGIKD